MDEPLSNLDAKLRLDMRTEIRRLHQNLGLTTVYVTHDQEEALSMADRLVVLREGRVQQVGTPEEVHTSPVNWHVADFMGYRNMVDMTVQSVSAGGVVLEGADGLVHATPVDEMAVGDVVRLAMRPEDVRIAEDGATPVNAIPATVAVVEYHGREFAVGTTTPSGLTVHVRNEVAPRLGEEVRLNLERQGIDLIPGDAVLGPDRTVEVAAPGSRSPEPEGRPWASCVAPGLTAPEIGSFPPEIKLILSRPSPGLSRV